MFPVVVDMKVERVWQIHAHSYEVHFSTVLKRRPLMEASVEHGLDLLWLFFKAC